MRKYVLSVFVCLGIAVSSPALFAQDTPPPPCCGHGPMELQNEPAGATTMLGDVVILDAVLQGLGQTRTQIVDRFSDLMFPGRSTRLTVVSAQIRELETSTDDAAAGRRIAAVEERYFL